MKLLLASALVCLQVTQATAQQYSADSPAGALLAQGITLPVKIPGEPCKSMFYPSTAVSLPTGTTTITFTISSDGSVKDIAVEQSGGSDSLDKGMVDCISTFHYKPATKNGQPVDVPWKIKSNWKIGPPPKATTSPPSAN